MHFKWILHMTAAIVAATVFAEARRVVLRQLTADQVYTVLRATGREDAVPEGRTVTQGIAAITGLGIGLAKGIAGLILYDVATSDATLQWLNSLNLASLFSGGTSGSGTNLITEEICFTTKGRRIESDVGAEGRQASPTTTTGGTTGGTTSSPTGSTTSSPTTSGGTTSTGPTYTSSPSTPTYSYTSSPTPTGSPFPTPPLPTPGVQPPPTPSPTARPTLSPAPSPTPSPTPSPISGASDQTCIVIQKPKPRKRRSVRHKRLLAH